MLFHRKTAIENAIKTTLYNLPKKLIVRGGGRIRYKTDVAKNQTRVGIREKIHSI